MTGNINLTTSMRTNLLSLQQISKLQDRTQLRLSTGLKVNSAIDNPSSYYTAQSLNNRADDLSALLDSMGQGIQTIKAASEGIETAEDLVTQMKAIAEQVSTSGAYVPDKEYFIKEVGENGAVVSTAEELRQAIADNKETICVYGQINLGDISTTGSLSLKENQKLVGVEYFGNFKDGEGFSGISATSSSTSGKSLISISKTGCLVSDLDLNFISATTSGSSHIINSSGTNIITDLQNLNVFMDCSKNQAHYNSAIYSEKYSIINIKGEMNIETMGATANGIMSLYYGNINVASSNLNITMTGHGCIGIYAENKASANILSDTVVNIYSVSSAVWGLCASVNSSISISGKFQTTTQYGVSIGTKGSGNNIIMTKDASIYLKGTSPNINNNSTNNTIQIASGVKIAFEKNGSTKWYQVKEDYRDENTETTAHIITADNVEATLNVASTSSWKTPADIIAEQEKEEAEAEKKSYATYQKQFNNALSQYDMLINDSAYKGINLLKEDTLKVNFNEDKSAHLLIQGVDMTSEGIGLLSADWNTDKDVQSSLEQVLSAQKKLRSAATKLGNCYSIVSERQNFTENLINVLTEGADKLTLADMNEESANMLALQTQQQLAINSLSLASQASQKVLRLF